VPAAAPAYDPDPLLTQEEAAAVLRITVRGVEPNVTKEHWGTAGKNRTPLRAIRAFRERQTVCPVPVNPHGSAKTLKAANGTSSITAVPAISGRERALATVQELKARSATS
jgi:hypothetical protein